MAKGDDRKISEICGVCEPAGSGQITKQVQRIVTDKEGNKVSITEDQRVTCPRCNGFGQYDVL